MNDRDMVPQTEYLHTKPENVESLVNKLMQFFQGLNSEEQALLLQCIKRGLPGSTGTSPDRVVEASPVVFAAWLNSVVSDASRWYPS